VLARGDDPPEPPAWPVVPLWLASVGLLPPEPPAWHIVPLRLIAVGLLPPGTRVLGFAGRDRLLAVLLSAAR
jgi:hypothetical protein